VAASLGRSRLQAAAGIYRMINLKMADGIRLMTLRRGVDPRRFALLSFGGAAGLHAAEVARHDLAAQCFLHHPELREKYAAQYRTKYGKEPPPTEDQEKAGGK